jgi:hypothetical protein
MIKEKKVSAEWLLGNSQNVGLVLLAIWCFVLVCIALYVRTNRPNKMNNTQWMDLNLRVMLVR